MINHNITFMISSPSHTTFHHPPPTQKYLVPIYRYSYDCTMYMGIFWGGGFSEICGFFGGQMACQSVSPDYHSMACGYVTISDSRGHM